MASLLFLVCSVVQAQVSEAAWQTTVQNVIPAVVTLRVSKARPFDTRTNALLDGTGFVVDAENGIILTNRHIVSTGPVHAVAIFPNHEEIEVERIYTDPVHDFGFLRYDPAELRGPRPTALTLAPEAAEVGREIRVVGNDAGNRISILDGTIARLDQMAPNYGAGRYNDFNTFYMQASSGTSGGSSGSPVIDFAGRAVALNAGAHAQAATSYFLPLERVQRALDLIRQGEPVPRGGLLSTFEQLPYAELRRLGLTEDAEARARAADSQRSGLLVVRSTVAESHASENLRPGDILLRVESVAFPDFAHLEEVLDAFVGWTVELAVERQGRVLELSLEVTDLHQVTPSEYITMGDAILHPISYQQARNFNVPLNAIYVAHNGYLLRLAGIENGSILREINGHTLRDLDDVDEALRELRHGDMAQYRFSDLRTPNTSQLRSARIARRWFAAQRCRQDVESHKWSCVALAPAGPAEPVEIRAAQARKFDDPQLKKIAPSLVHVRFEMPFTVSGIEPRKRSGAGLIVDAERGWVVVDRSTVPEMVGDAVLTFNGTLEVTANVAYVHPIHNLAVLRYDPRLLAGTPVREAEFAPNLPAPGQEVFLAGFGADQELTIRSYKAGGLLFLAATTDPMGAYRDTNLEALELRSADANLSGVLLDSKGRVSALWTRFVLESTDKQIQIGLAGLPVSHVQTMLRHITDGAPLRSLEVIWQRVPLSIAVQRGLDEAWRARMEEHDPQRLLMLAVDRTVAGTPAAEAFLPGDLLLSINGKVATRPQDVERIVAGHVEADILVWRNGQEMELGVHTVKLGWRGLREVLFWAGAVLQDPHRGLAAQLGLAPQGVAVQQFNVGSPAHRSIHPLRCFQITRLNQYETPNLKAFVEALELIGNTNSVRVEGVTDKGVQVFGTVRLAPGQWPTNLLRHGANGWKRTRLSQ